MSVSRIISVMLFFISIYPSYLAADNGGGTSSGMGALFGSIIFLVILICFFIATKIFSYLRGGEMATGWQFLSISFIILCLSQLIAVASSLELFSLSSAIVEGFRLLGVFVLLVGVSRIKKVLS